MVKKGTTFVLEKSYPRRGDREQIVLVTPDGVKRPKNVKQLARADKKKQKGDTRTWVYKESHRFFDAFIRKFREAGYEVTEVFDGGNKVYLVKGAERKESITEEIGIF